MAYSLSSISPYLIYHFKSEHELVEAIEELSLKFTKKREKISDYLKDPRLVSAYTAFYFLTNIPKLSEVLKWLPHEWVEKLKECDFVDLGSGPGTFSLAWKEFGGQGRFYQVESSSLMREQAQKIWEGFFKDPIEQSSRWEWRTDRPRFLLFGHSANEMELQEIIEYIKIINPEHLLFIEPGTKDFFQKMLNIRSYLINENYRILFPCPQQTGCPMEGTQDWCHQFISLKQDLEVERISQMAKKDRKLLPLTVGAFSRMTQFENSSERLVRVFPETKFSHEWLVCHDNKLENYQLMKRDLSKEESKRLSSLLSGRALVTEVIKKLDHAKRVKLK
jgi:ribosomal protein RSM22 (predicted rRNA methylase)